ncbi:TolB family protein [Teichococcus vastitatis]|uniref:PD40 domain-containing protein n=1 Tax=Teichococcus vastitatis TaxID=2307076 RepID=A0ABS9WA41_9PROT|nr:PD40 domain-containing protein [Pseudoroseomonas vastitatis]MCI0756169.1 PD40 domain-containing protein [Pseudoroseomonas vastitatis]
MATAVPPVTATLDRLNLGPGGVQADAGVQGFAVSADGTRLVLLSAAGNLVAGDGNDAADLFILGTGGSGGFTRAVTAFEDLGQGWSAALAGSAAQLSADGRSLAFLGSQLTASGPAYDVFVKDLTTGTVQRAGIDASGLTVPAWTLSADGRKLAFVSTASTLVPGSTPGGAQIFIRDLATSAVTLVSRDAAGHPLAGPYAELALSRDGTQLAFTSSDPALTGSTSGIAQLFVRNLLTGSVILASADARGNAASAASSLAVFSPDGSQIAFVSAPPTCPPPRRPAAPCRRSSGSRTCSPAA